jgi:hypothetical protein
LQNLRERREPHKIVETVRIGIYLRPRAACHDATDDA